VYSIAFTGHRPNKLGHDYNLVSPQVKAIRDAIVKVLNEQREQHSEIKTIVGGALGIDTLAAIISIEMKIPYTLAIPCLNQDIRWIDSSRNLYRYIREHALCTPYQVYDGEYNDTCMQERNEWMVNNCDLLISVWDGTSGGTANCCRYAIGLKKPRINIHPKTLKVAKYNV